MSLWLKNNFAGKLLKGSRRAADAIFALMSRVRAKGFAANVWLITDGQENCPRVIFQKKKKVPTTAP